MAIDNDLVSGTLTRGPKELLTAAQSLVYNSSFDFPLLTNINIIVNDIMLLGKPSAITTEKTLFLGYFPQFHPYT